MKPARTAPNTTSANRTLLYRAGGLAALLTVAVALAEMVVTFLPGGSAPVDTVVDWFTQLQNSPFMSLRNLGLLNIVMFAMGIPMYFALFSAHREQSELLAPLAISLSYIGVAVFFATNRAFAMLDLSQQYAVAGEWQRPLIAAAGQALLSVGRSHSPGTFLGFIFGEIAGILMSLVMLRGRIFSRAAAFAGLIGFGLLLVYEVWNSFFPALGPLPMLFAILGGVLNIVWLVLIGREFLRRASAPSGQPAA